MDSYLNGLLSILALFKLRVTAALSRWIGSLVLSILALFFVPLPTVCHFPTSRCLAKRNADSLIPQTECITSAAPPNQQLETHTQSATEWFQQSPKIVASEHTKIPKYRFLRRICTIWNSSADPPDSRGSSGPGPRDTRLGTSLPRAWAGRMT